MTQPERGTEWSAVDDGIVENVENVENPARAEPGPRVRDRAGRSRTRRPHRRRTLRRVDLAPLIKAAPQVVAADAAVQGAVRRLAAIDDGALVAQVAAPLADLDTQVREVAGTTATASRAVQLLPAMLGADGPREYLLLVQNNAEQRATGGIPGSVLLVRATDGAVEVLEQVALKTDGTLWAWGWNAYGQLGTGTGTGTGTGAGTVRDRARPTRVGEAAHWVSVAANGYATVALRS